MSDYYTCESSPNNSIYNDEEKIKEKIDVELLISEIEVRPVIWDISLEEYKDKTKKNNAWEEVYSAINENYKTLASSKQYLFGKSVQIKWKNLKDYHHKCKRSQVTALGSAAKKKRKYIYEDQLQFLNKCYLTTVAPNKTNTSIFSSSNNFFASIIDEPSPLRQENDQEEQLRHIPSRNKINKNINNIEERIIHYLDNQRQQHPFMDEHEAFFKSLLPNVRRLNEDQVLEFRAAVINIIQNIRKKTSDEFESYKSSSN